MGLLSKCPDPEALRALAVGQLDEARGLEVRTHLAACASCSETTRALEEWAGFEETGAFAGEASADGSATVPADGEGASGLSDLDLSFLAPTVCYRSIGRIGAYEVVSLLGRGGMGLVFKGLDQSLGRSVAVKVLSPRLSSCSRSRRRFLREARAAAAISHPGVVTIHGVGVHRGLPFLVMEFIDGWSLRQRLRREPRLRLAEVLRIVSQVLDGLHAAHKHGVIHRDISPSNIMLEGELERVKITDFGLARIAQGVSGLTSVDQVIGTPAFMAPEQVMGEPVDGRSDLFSLGCVIYAMVTGRSPFKGGHPLDVVRRVREWDPPPLVEAVPECPPELSSLVARLMSKAPAARFPSAVDVLKAIRPLLVAANLSDSGDGDPPVVVPDPEPPVEVSPPAVAGLREADRHVETDSGLTGPGYERALPSPWRSSAVGMPVLRLVRPASRVWKAIGSWRKRASPPRKPVERIVGRSAPGAFRSLARALDQAGPGDLIRIVDDEFYDGQVWIDDPERWSGLTIEAAPGFSPTLVASNGPGVVTIRDVPEVVVRNLTIRARPDQAAVRVEGRVEGLTLQSLRSEKPAGSPEPHVWIGSGPQGPPSRSVSVRSCRFSGGSAGVVVQGSPNRPARCLKVEENEFRDLDVHLSLRAHLADVSVVGNRFSGGTVGILMDVPPLRAERLEIGLNSLIGVSRWLDPGGSDPEQTGVTVARNAVFESSASDPENERRLVLMARSGWLFEANLRESSRSADAAEGLLFRSVERLEVVSRNPDSPRFLHPAPGSLLFGAGPGAHAGAFPRGWVEVEGEGASGDAPHGRLNGPASSEWACPEGRPRACP